MRWAWEQISPQSLQIRTQASQPLISCSLRAEEPAMVGWTWWPTELRVNMLGTRRWDWLLVHWGCGNLLNSNRKQMQWSYLNIGKSCPSHLGTSHLLKMKTAIAAISWPSSLSPTRLSSLLSLGSWSPSIPFLPKLLPESVWCSLAHFQILFQMFLIHPLSVSPGKNRYILKWVLLFTPCLVFLWHLLPPGLHHCWLLCYQVSPFRMPASSELVFHVFFSYISSTHNIE